MGRDDDAIFKMPDPSVESLVMAPFWFESYEWEAVARGWLGKLELLSNSASLEPKLDWGCCLAHCDIQYRGEPFKASV